MNAASSFLSIKEENNINTCFLCGSPCGEIPKSTCIREGFTNWDIVSNHGSAYVCSGCSESMSEKSTITLIDGSTRLDQKRRLYSWLLTNDRAIAATKSHLAQIKTFILNPPEPPFSIVLSDSGQKHFIWRTPINYNSDSIMIRLEDDIITIERQSFGELLTLSEHAIAACGKPGLYDNNIGLLYIKFIEYYGDEIWADRWFAVANNSSTRLAWWLTPGMEACREWHPTTYKRLVQTSDSGFDEHRSSSEQGRRRSLSGSRDQMELPFG